MKKAIIALAAMTAMVTILTGCDVLLNPSSLYAGVDGPDTAAVASMNGNALIDTLDQQNGSDEFYSSLSDSEVAKIDAKLAALENDGDPETASAASLARVELTLETNPAVNTTINNIADMLLDSDSISSTAGMIDSLTSAIPRDTASLASFLDDMKVISDSYGNVAAKGTGDVSAGDLQNYIVAAVFDTIVEVYSGDTAQAADALIAFMANPENPDMNALLPDSIATTDEYGNPTTISDQAAIEDYFENQINGANGKIDTVVTLANIAGLDSIATKIQDTIDQATSGSQG